jgi:hypothetical protein
LALVPLVSASGLAWSSGRNRAPAGSIAGSAARSLDREGKAILTLGSRVAGSDVIRSGGTRGLVPPYLPGSTQATDDTVAPQSRPPVVLLTIEPAAGLPALDAEVPVVLPGYVLPVDSLEEPAHEGS